MTGDKCSWDTHNTGTNYIKKSQTKRKQTRQNFVNHSEVVDSIIRARKLWCRFKYAVIYAHSVKYRL